MGVKRKTSHDVSTLSVESPREQFYRLGPIRLKGVALFPIEMSLSKRLPKEIAASQTDEMKGAGIFYEHDDTNVDIGRAIIVGPDGTPYANCPLMFRFEFSRDYPFTPPSVKFMTSDGTTRFHPNLYVNGKVCLSILGTWSGPRWAPAMSISTVLSSIQSLLEPNPITNEPGWETMTLENEKAKFYADFVHSRLTSYTFRNLYQWKYGIMPAEWTEFAGLLDECGTTVLEKLQASILSRATESDTTYTNIVYAMSGTTDWEGLRILAGKIVPAENALKDSIDRNTVA